MISRPPLNGASMISRPPLNGASMTSRPPLNIFAKDGDAPVATKTTGTTQTKIFSVVKKIMLVLN